MFLKKNPIDKPFFIRVFGFYKDVGDWRLYVWGVSRYTWKAEDSC